MPHKPKRRPFLEAELEEPLRTITTRVPASMHRQLCAAIRHDRTANTIVYCALKAYLPTLETAATAAGSGGESRPQFFDGLGQGASHSAAAAERGDQQETVPHGEAWTASRGA